MDTMKQCLEEKIESMIQSIVCLDFITSISDNFSEMITSIKKYDWT